MRFRAAMLGLMALLSTGLATAQACDEPATRALLQRIDAAWDSRDSAAMAALYVPDASLSINAGAVKAQGQEAVLKTFAALLGRLETGDVHRLTLRGLASAGPFCVADALADIGVPGAQQRFAGTYVLAAGEGGWRIVAARATAMR